MARTDRSGEMPSVHGEWHVVNEALQVAIRMATRTEQAVRSIVPLLIRMKNLTDPRMGPVLTRSQSDMLRFLDAQFRLSNPDPQDAMNIADAFQRIRQRLGTFSRSHFRMVSQAIASQESNRSAGDTFGYFDPQQPNLIYLNEMYFSRGSGRDQPAPVPRPRVQPAGRQRAVVTTLPEEMHILYSLDERAGVILHETVHMLYGADGAVHRAVRDGTAIAEAGGDVGFPQIRSFMQATSDAYVYERFAKAVNALAA